MGNLRIAPLEFSKFTYPVLVLNKVSSEIPFNEDSYHIPAN